MAVPPKADGPDPPAKPDPFELFSFPSLDSPPPMCSAADVFLSGKIPFLPPHPKRTDIGPGALRWREASEASEVDSELSHRRRRLWGGGVKAEYRRLRSVSDCRGKAAAATRQQKQQRPRWYLCLLGSMRLPATMDMSDIRSRQRRQSAAAASDPGGGSVGDVGRGTWRLLRSLSCTGLESASAVTAPLRLAAHV